MFFQTLSIGSCHIMFFTSNGWDYVFELRPPIGQPVYSPHDMSMEPRWYWHRKAEELIEEPVPLPLCPPQIPHRLTWASMVRCRRLTTWAMALPGCHVKILAWWHYLIKLTYFDRREALWDESKNSLLLAYNHSVKLFHCLKVLYLNHDALEVGSAFIFRWPLEGQNLLCWASWLSLH
jgi:hypothetical protein